MFHTHARNRRPQSDSTSASAAITVSRVRQHARSLLSTHVSEEAQHSVRIAGLDDVEAIGRLLHDFNREFDEPTPSPSALAARFRSLLAGGDTFVVLAGNGPDGVAVLRCRMAIWSAGLECYLAELYVVPNLRGIGIGRALMNAALHEARQRGADTMDIGVDEPDEAARNLYESLGFSHRVGGPDGPVMYFYEREL
jgi:ribosomal protein S18 acetylase RimI-like enzyme